MNTNNKVKINKDTTACLTGHRPKSLPWGYNEAKESCIKFKQDLAKIFEGAIRYGLTTFLTGMAEGFDMIGTEVLLKLRKKHNIQIIAVVPCVGQELKWKPSQQNRYNNILNQCDNVIILSSYYTASCMNDRNKYMVDNSSVCIACWNGKPSGTRNTLLYAKETKCKVKIINI